MIIKRALALTAAGVALSLPALALSAPAEAAPAKVYKNCTALNKDFPHGVGKKGAKDKVSGRTKKVTTFKVSNALYQANKKSDRDKDGIACEKL